MSAQAIRIEEIQDGKISTTDAIARLARVKVNPIEKKNFTIASLFAGIGGIDLAFQNAGFQIKWANEIDKHACKTYSQNFHNIICDDIKNLDTSKLSKVDILTGGFPCQAFSIAGYRKGFDDERGSLIFEVVRIVKELMPRVVFLENVKNLKSHLGGKTLQHIIDAFEKASYTVKTEIMNACEYSEIPQNRERLYIVCFKNEKDAKKFSFPEKINKRLEIQNLIDNKADDSFYYKDTKYYSELKKVMHSKNAVYQWRRKYVRENKNNLCPTLTANMGTGGHNVPLVIDSKDIRKLTPRECARFQGFPESFILPFDLPNSSLYKQIGNSVCVPVVEALAKNIMIVLQV